MQQVYGYCIFKNGKEAKIAYPLEGLPKDVSGVSFHNGRFVQKLRQAAAAHQNVTVRQGIAKQLLNGESFDNGQLPPIIILSACGDSSL